MDHLKAKIREIPDFPKKGILFYDITTLLCDGKGFQDTVDALAAPYMGEDIEQVIGIESRGFILGAAVANALGCGFVPVRKPGKLPGATHQQAYSLEYGENALEVAKHAIEHGARVVIHDDVVGGSSLADSMAKHPKTFSGVYVAMVRAGEAGGYLDVDDPLFDGLPRQSPAVSARAFYLQLGYRLPQLQETLKPYYRYERVDTGAGDPLLDERDLFAHTLGLRYDITLLGAPPNICLERSNTLLFRSTGGNKYTTVF